MICKLHNCDGKRKMDFRNFSVENYPQIFENLNVRELNSVKDSQGYLIVNTNIDSRPFSQDYGDIFIVRNASPYEHLVYVLPNDKMIEHECVYDQKQILGQQHIRLYLCFDEGKLKTSNWPGEFLIDLRDPNHEERLKLICDKQRYHIKTPVVLNKPEKMWYVDAKTYRCLLLKWNIPFSFPPYNFFNKILVWGKKVQELTFRAGGVLYFAWGDAKEYRPNHFDHAYARIPGTDNFYFVPMTAFVENGKIGYSKSSKEMKVSLDMNKASPDKNNWIDKYRFNFNDTDIYERFNFLINGIIPKGKEEIYTESKEVEEKYSHIIGESPIENIFGAVELEYKTGMRPKVIREKIKGNESHMERYGIYLAMYAINQNRYGQAILSYDGGDSDFFYHEKDTDKCIGIQVKTTAQAKSKNAWFFSYVNKNYDGMLMYLRCLEDGMGWLISHRKMTAFTESVHLLLCSKSPNMDWNKYRVRDSDLADLISRYYNSGEDLIFKKSSDIIEPTCPELEVEQRNRKKLASFYKSIEVSVSAPVLENMVFDNLVEGLKTQEKTARKTATAYYDVPLSKTSKGKSVPYHERDFHILAVPDPSPEGKSAFFIPMFKLAENSAVSTDLKEGNKGLTVCFDPNNFKLNWTDEFLINFEHPDSKERLLNIFHMQRSGNHTPIPLKNPSSQDMHATNFQQMMTKWNKPFTFAKPKEPFRFIVNGKRGQELKFNVSKEGYCLCLTYQRQTVKYTYNPHDFEFAYCKLRGKYLDFFLLIPMIEFVKSNIINFIKSKTQLTINFNMEKRTADFDWFFKYLYGFSETNFGERFDNFLAEL